MSNPLRLSERRSRVPLFIAVLLLTWSVADRGAAAIYSWKDENGKVFFTDDLSKIPLKYRSKEGGLAKHRELSAPPVDLAKDIPGLAIGPAGFKEYVVPLVSSGSGNAFVDVVLNDGVKAKLMVDTGASMITLSGKIARKLGLAGDGGLPEMPFTTAGGVVWSPIVVLQSVKAGDAEVVNAEAGVNSQMGDLDGLLGMNFLGEFNMNMDQARGNMVLKPLGRSGEPAWAGKNALWWKNKFTYYSGIIKQYKVMAEDFARKKHPKTESLNNLVGYYQRINEQLSALASNLGIPAEFQSAGQSANPRNDGR